MRRNALFATGMLFALLATAACTAPSDADSVRTSVPADSGVAIGADPNERPTADVGASQLAAAERAREAARKSGEAAAQNGGEATGAATAEPSATASLDAAPQDPAQPPRTHVPATAGPTGATATPTPVPTGSGDSEDGDPEDADPEDGVSETEEPDSWDSGSDVGSHPRDRREDRRPGQPGR